MKQRLSCSRRIIFNTAAFGRAVRASDFRHLVSKAIARRLNVANFAISKRCRDAEDAQCTDRAYLMDV